MKTKALLTALTALTATAIVGSAHAATIALEDSAVFADKGKDTLTDAEIGGLDVSNGDKLVVTLSFEGDDSGPNSTVTYNGAEMTEAVTHVPSTSGWVGIYYLDNVSSVGAGTLDFTNDGYSTGVSFMVLSGTAAGVGNVNSASATSLNLPVSAGSFMVAAWGDTADSSADADSPLIELLDSDDLVAAPDDGSATHVSGYQFISSDGTATPSFTSGTSRPNTVAAEFLAVPEPGSLALLGLGGLLVASRRRRG